VTTRIENQPTPSILVSRAYLLDAFLRNIVRVYFQTNPLQGYPGISRLVWVPDERAGGTDVPGTIRIDLLDAWNPSRVDSMPAVIVSAGDLASVRLGIADRHMSPHEPDLTGAETKSRAWVGSVTIFAMARKYAQSRLIAFSIAEHMQNLSSQIACQANIMRFEVSKILTTKPLKEQHTILVTPVLIEYGFIETWKVIPAAPPLNRFAVVPTID